MKFSAILSAAVLSAGVLVSAPGTVAADDRPVTVVGEIVRYEPGHVTVVRTIMLRPATVTDSSKVADIITYTETKTKVKHGRTETKSKTKTKTVGSNQ